MGSGEGLKFEKIGDTHMGTLVRIDSRTDTDPSGTVKKWEDGSPKKVYMWTLQVGGDEEELATLWVRGNMVKALREAALEAGVKKGADLIGSKVVVRYHANGEPSTKGFAPPKLFMAKITLPPKEEAVPIAEYDPFQDS